MHCNVIFVSRQDPLQDNQPKVPAISMCFLPKTSCNRVHGLDPTATFAACTNLNAPQLLHTISYTRERYCITCVKV